MAHRGGEHFAAASITQNDELKADLIGEGIASMTASAVLGMATAPGAVELSGQLLDAAKGIAQSGSLFGSLLADEAGSLWIGGRFRAVPLGGAPKGWWPRVSKTAPDWGSKGAHIHVGDIELAVRPAADGSVVFRSVFSSQDPAAVNAASRVATEALGDVGFRRILFNATGRALDLIGGSGRGAELRFLMHALEKMGL
jgi:hypothetical protein